MHVNIPLRTSMVPKLLTCCHIAESQVLFTKSSNKTNVSIGRIISGASDPIRFHVQGMQSRTTYPINEPLVYTKRIV